ncbi:MAG: M20/M25/M40 family metallo-hydrolase [Bacteroidales bacterium]
MKTFRSLFLMLIFATAQTLAAQNPWIQPIVQSVSGDSIFATIADLQPMDRVNANNSMVPANYLKQRLQAYRMDTVFFQYFKPNTPPNVVAIRYGTVQPNEYWVMGGHYDAVVPGAGADDNASGTAAVIEMARVINDYELEKSLILVLFSAEEVGLWGSKAFVDSAVNHFNIAGMINLDMIAYSHALADSSVSVCWRYFCAGLMQDYLTATGIYVPELEVDQDSVSVVLYASDHAPFWAKMIPALFLIENSDRFGGAFNPYYHQFSDTIGLGANSKWLAEKITRSAIAALMVITKPFSTISIPVDRPDLTGISVYPNPASTNVTVTGIPGVDHGSHLYILDCTGKMLYHQSQLQNGSVIDISQLPSGIYFMQFIDYQGSEVKKLIIR